jgi:hypothetical protein
MFAETGSLRISQTIRALALTGAFLVLLALQPLPKSPKPRDASFP